MTELYARNVNEALPKGLAHLQNFGIIEQSRYGDVLVSPGPVMTVYEKPLERVLFSHMRNANPWFHLLGDSLWLLAGRNDIAWPCYFNAKFKEFSDDGIIAPGAYGFRWRDYFGVDQLAYVVEELKARPDSRRAVLQMWHPEDFARMLAPGGTRDAPCNTSAMFDCRGCALNMTVTCRSNDIWWGAYGANVVQFSILQELLAFWIGYPVGIYRQFSNNFHLYTSIVSRDTADAVMGETRFSTEYPGTLPLVTHSAEVFLKELEEWMAHPLDAVVFTEPFFMQVARPMYAAWEQRKRGTGTGMPYAMQIKAPDWRKACVEWIGRAEERKLEKEHA